MSLTAPNRWTLVTPGLIALYALIRLLSWWTHDQAILQAIIVITLLCGFGITYFIRRDLALSLLVTELVLGGAGNFFQFIGLSLRTILLGAFLGLTVFFTVYQKKFTKTTPWLWPLLGASALAISWAVIRGFWLQNPTAAIIADSIPFLYLILAVPLSHFKPSPSTRRYLIHLASAWLLGTALFSILIFIRYVSGTNEIHDWFYHWLRDVAGAKITFITPWFYRIVFPEQLLTVPAALLCLSMLMRRDAPPGKWWWLYGAAATILALNFSRAYFLGLIIGTLVLLWTHRPARWLKISVLGATTFVTLFVSICLLSSRGTNTGWPLLTGRVSSISAPTSETSSATRLLLLPIIQTKINQHPLIGNGLGSTITFYDPYLERTVTTTNYDWGYLELWSELGLGALAYFGVWLAAILLLIKKIRATLVDTDVLVGILAGLIALLTITITSPALFHVFGTVYLSITLGIVFHPISQLRTMTNLVANYFRRSL